jgi:hypothetical protein
VTTKSETAASAVRASGPTARPAHASLHLIDANLNAALSGGILLGRSNPTDPLVSRQRGYVGPEVLGSGIKLDGFSEICRQLMDRAIREFLTSHTSIGVCFAQQVIEPTYSSPGFAWLANVFMVHGWGWHPKVEMKAVCLQREKSCLRIKGASRVQALSVRSIGKHAELRD